MNPKEQKDLASQIFWFGTVGNIVAGLIITFSDPLFETLMYMAFVELVVLLISLMIFSEANEKQEQQQKQNWKENLENRLEKLEKEVESE